MSVRVIETSFTGKSPSRSRPATAKSERSRSEQHPRQRKLIPQRSRSFDPNNRSSFVAPLGTAANENREGLLKTDDIHKIQECICGPNIYGTLLGPTVDEQILAGLSALFKLCDDCPPETEEISDFETQPSQPSIYDSGVEEEKQISHAELLGPSSKAGLLSVERSEIGVYDSKREIGRVKREEEVEEEKKLKVDAYSMENTKLQLPTTYKPQSVERAYSGENRNIEVNSTSTGSSNLIVKESLDTGSGTESRQTKESAASTETTHTSASQTEQLRIEHSEVQAHSAKNEDSIFTRTKTESSDFKPNISESPIAIVGKPPSKVVGNSSLLQNVTNYPTYESLRQQSNHPSLDDKVLQRSYQTHPSPYDSQQYERPQSKEQNISMHNNSQYQNSLTYSDQHKQISLHDPQQPNYLQVSRERQNNISSHNSILKVPRDPSRHSGHNGIDSQKNHSHHNNLDSANDSQHIKDYQKNPLPFQESKHHSSHHTSLNHLPESSGHLRRHDCFHPCKNRERIKSNTYDSCTCCCTDTISGSSNTNINVPVNKLPLKNEKRIDFCCGSDQGDSGTTETQESSTSYTCIPSSPGTKSTIKIKLPTNFSCQFDTESTKESSTSSTSLDMYCDKCSTANTLKRKICASKPKKEATQNTTGIKNNCRYKRVTVCPCNTSTTTTTSSYEAGEDGQNGDHKHSEVRYAITKITKFSNYTTFEVMKSTKKKPKVMPTKLEGVFVLRNRKQD